MECFKCGISGERAKLFDAITREGIVKVCEKCSLSEDHPIIRKPTSFQLKEIERKPGVYEMLSKMAGVNPNERRDEKPVFLIKEESSLRAIVDKNYTEKARKTAKSRHDLIDNFHWVLMRTRRSKKVTQKQLAEAIGEAEAAIRLAEEGVLPDDSNKLLNKMQNYLGINLFKDGIKIIQEKPLPAKEIIFDRKSPTTITISDLKKIREEISPKRGQDKEETLSKRGQSKEGRGNEEGYEFLSADREETEKEKTKDKDEKDLSDADIHNLLFKR